MEKIVTIAVSMFIAACSLIALADEPVTIAVIVQLIPRIHKFTVRLWPSTEFNTPIQFIT